MTNLSVVNKIPFDCFYTKEQKLKDDLPPLYNTVSKYAKDRVEAKITNAACALNLHYVETNIGKKGKLNKPLPEYVCSANTITSIILHFKQLKNVGEKDLQDLYFILYGVFEKNNQSVDDGWEIEEAEMFMYNNSLEYDPESILSLRQNSNVYNINTFLV